MSLRGSWGIGAAVTLPLGALCAALAGCATPAPVAAGRLPPPAPDLLETERARTASDQAEAARRAAAEGRLHEALWRWRVVEAVAGDPDSAHAQASSLQAEASAQAAAQAARGEAGRRAHDNAAASAAFQAALQLDPRQPAALAGLREIETAEALRLVSQEQAAARRPRRRARAKP